MTYHTPTLTETEGFYVTHVSHKIDVFLPRDFDCLSNLLRYQSIQG